MPDSPLSPEEQDWIEHHRYTRMPPRGEAMPDTGLEKLTTEELREFISRDASSSGERWMSGWAEIRRRLERLEKCEAAIRWALGEEGDFPTRQTGQGAYWWRTELRNRAALEGK